MPVVPRRYRWWVVLAAAAFALTLLIGIWRPIHSTRTPSIRHESSVAQAALLAEQPAVIDWGAMEAPQAPPVQPLLQVGAYITNVSDINLMDNQFFGDTFLSLEF